MAILEQLSNELVEIIVRHLSLQDVCSLRLANRAVCLRATQDTFKKFFRSKTVDLTRKGLEDFFQVTEFSRLACSVQELSLAGIVYNTTELERTVKDGQRYQPKDISDPYETLSSSYDSVTCTEDEVKQVQVDLDELTRLRQDLVELQTQDFDFSLLGKAFSSIATNNAKGLKSLSLEVVVFKDLRTRLPPRRGKAWKWIFQAAARTFPLALTCCHDSHLLVERLDVFASKPKNLSCSLTCDTLASMDWEVLKHNIGSLKSLCISVSDCIIDASEGDVIDSSGDLSGQEIGFQLMTRMRDQEPLRRQILAEENASIMGRLLSVADNLEELEISYFRLGCKNHELRERMAEMRYRWMFHLARMQKPLKRLRKLRLGGFWVKQEDLSAFMKAYSTPLEEVELSSIHLSGDESFDPVMSLLKDMGLQNIYLEDLMAQRSLVLFDKVNSDSTRVEGAYLGRNAIAVWGEDARKQIACGPYRGRSVDTGKIRLLRRRQRLEYGPA